MYYYEMITKKKPVGCAKKHKFSMLLFVRHFK